ncbi:DUF1989 domain-containing protein [Sphingoaurantiacus capsulatus]|uniref:DUF1989 domain-containing protein n=1 Tax=Sphingoaurantiacus capsulatus TaxID=1771310 RepID=A0ABV7XC17_9SPHN
MPAASGVGLRLRKGEHLRLVDPEGGQTGDLVAYSADGSERLSSGRTFDYNEKVRLSTGDALWSDRSNRLLTIIADEVGRHDMFYAACTREMYALQYGIDDHPNCHDNLSAALRGQGIDPVFLPQTLNFFMNVEIDEEGRLSIAPARSWPGAAMVLRAEMDLIVALSACPSTMCNGGVPPRPLGFEILEP